ncbi:O-antigen ligase family protein [Asticcacaulis machinosus]|uniref:O-antigen ligase n=1 Tax=Asticcacaulis machinosus TaxID=2984211 RepID=A0ABT5HJK6_9CAUL|nr:O-antigen ligase [Asticcacaulis machinosus]MDC7676432.1 O-antigen ligase [Asticcacaulis machinosus]
MTTTHREGRRVPYDPGIILRINIPIVLTFLCLAALMLEPLFTSAAALAFLIFGAFLMLHRTKLSLTTLNKHWFLLILPVYCLLSVFWSQYPAVSARQGFQLALSLIIAIVIASRVPARNLFFILFVCNVMVLGLCLLFGARPSGAAWQGIFASKNAFATVIAMVFLFSLAMLYEKRMKLTLKIVALGIMSICPFLLLKAQSAGVIMGLVPPVLLMVLFQMTRGWKPVQRIAMLTFGTWAAIVAGLALAPYFSDIFASVLRHFGKDPTLTGRTELWDIAFAHIAEHPLLGIGYRAYWVVGNPDAEALWLKFGVKSGGGFHFHNLYISNAVEIGLIGVAIQSIILYGTFIAAIHKLIMTPSTEKMFFVMFLLFIIYRSFGEVQLFFGFSDVSILIYAICVYSLKKEQPEPRPSSRTRRTRRAVHGPAPAAAPEPEASA